MLNVNEPMQKKAVLIACALADEISVPEVYQSQNPKRLNSLPLTLVAVSLYNYKQKIQFAFY